MNDREFGEMAANIKNLCAAVKKLDEKLDVKLADHDEKIEELQKSQSRQKGFILGLAMTFPLFTGGLVYILEHIGK